jgi:hypothetical protein
MCHRLSNCIALFNFSCVVPTVLLCVFLRQVGGARGTPNLPYSGVAAKRSAINKIVFSKRFSKYLVQQGYKANATFSPKIDGN